FVIPQRWVMAIMGFLAVANAYTMRVCLNIAITQMVRRHASTAAYEVGSCPGDVDEIAADSKVCIIKLAVTRDFVARIGRRRHFGSQISTDK
ncbi:jg18381, partial [Pararge aegeria aegeria]